MAEVTMSLEEYIPLTQELADLRGEPRRSTVATAQVRQIGKKKRVGKKDPKMARALTKANELGRKKSGEFKKGWDQGKIMSKAHQLRRRM